MEKKMRGKKLVITNIGPNNFSIVSEMTSRMMTVIYPDDMAVSLRKKDADTVELVAQASNDAPAFMSAFDMRFQTVHGAQTNIASVSGSVRTGPSGVEIDGEKVTARPGVIIVRVPDGTELEIDDRGGVYNFVVYHGNLAAKLKSGKIEAVSFFGDMDLNPTGQCNIKAIAGQISKLKIRAKGRSLATFEDDVEIGDVDFVTDNVGLNLKTVTGEVVHSITDDALVMINGKTVSEER